MSAANLQTVSVSSDSYPTDPQVSLGFEPDSTLFLNRSSTATDIVYISVDGANDTALLIPGLMPALEYRTKYKKYWLRRDAAASTTTVNVMANTVR